MVKRIIYAAGTWDLLHSGHIRFLKTAKKMGYYLIASVTTDRLVREYKGAEPIMTCKQRCEIMKELRCVDKVTTHDKLFCVDSFKKAGADIYVTGSDWKEKENTQPGLMWLKQSRCLKYIPYTKGLSSSIIKNKIATTFREPSK